MGPEEIQPSASSQWEVIATVLVWQEPEGVAYDSANGYVYVANAESNNLTVINGATNKFVGSITVRSFPDAVAFDAANGYVYVTAGGANNVTVINGATDAIVVSVPVGFDPDALAYDSANGYLYVANYGAGGFQGSSNVTVVNGATDKVVESIPVGSVPFGVTYDSANGRLYVANEGSNIVSVVNGATDKVVGSITVGSEPIGLAYDSANGYVYVANAGSNNLTVVNGATDKVVGSITVGSWPDRVAYDSANGYVFVTDEVSNSVTVINGATDAIVGSVPVGTYPDALAYDSANGDVYVANSLTYTVSVIGMVYPVTFTESGLPSGTKWFVNLSTGESNSSTTNAIGFSEPNGNYIYTVSTTNEDYYASGGSFTVDGGAVSETVSFSLVTYPVYFEETGLPPGTWWSVVVNRSGAGSYGSSIVLDVPVGTSSYTVASVAGYAASPNSGVLTVTGQTEVAITFTRVTYPVTYTESGLPGSTEWFVNLTYTAVPVTGVVASARVGSYPYGVAYDSGKGEVFVANYYSDNVSVINDTYDAVVATVAVGTWPYGVAYDPAKGEVFVANYGSANVSVISDTNDTVVATVPVGAGPWGVAYDSGKGEVFVANYGSGNVSVISDTTDTAVATVAVGACPTAVAYDSGKGEVFVANWESYNVSVISDTNDTVVAWVPVIGYDPDALAYDARADEVFVGGGAFNSGFLDVISDSANAVVDEIIVPGTVEGVAYDSGKGEVYAANVNEEADLSLVTVVSTVSDTVLESVPVGYFPVGLAYDPAKGEVFVANEGSNDVYVISDATEIGYAWYSSTTSTVDFPEPNGSYAYTVSSTNPLFKTSGGSLTVAGTAVSVPVKFTEWYPVTVTESGLPSGTEWFVNETTVVVGTVPVGSEPWGVAYDSGKGEVFVANAGSGNVSVIDDTTDTVVANVTVGTEPYGLAYDPGKGEVFVANWGSDTVSVINDTTDMVVATIPVGSGPWGVAYDPGKGEVFVANIYSDTVSVISDKNNLVVATVAVGSYPTGLAYDSGKGEVFVANDGTDNVSVISDKNNLVVATVAVGSYPVGLAYDPAKAEVFVADYGSATVSVILDATDKVVATVAVGSYPWSVAYDSGKREVFVANAGTDNVSVISDATDAVVTTVAVGSSPFGVAYDSGKGEVFVANGGSNNVTLVGGVSHSSTTDAIGFDEPNGTYSYTIGSANTSWAAPAGSLVVNGASVSKVVAFQLVTYVVTFTETGLPAKTLAKDGWTVELGGTVTTVRSATATFEMPNGTDEYLLVGPSGYWVTEYATSGTVSVDGRPVAEEFAFAKGATVSLTFGEKGLPKGQSWCVEVSVDKVCSTTASLKYANLTPATYSYSVVLPLSGQTITGKVGTVVVTLTAGVSATVDLTSSTKVALTFAYPYVVKFTQSGLTSGTWSVTVKGSTKTEPYSSSIEFNETNGTYGYKAGAVSGFTNVASPKKAVVNGAGVTVTVTYTAKKGKSGSPAMLVGMALMVAAVVPAGRRRARSRA